MSVARYLFGFAMLSLASARAAAPPVPVPADVAVTLAASPSANLVPGQPIILTLTATNLGPAPVQRLQILSSPIYDEIDLNTVWTDCQVMTFINVDTIDGSFLYYYSWYPTDASTLAVGETRSCHFGFALLPTAPSVFTFSFGVPYYYADINPDNNVGTVVLRQAIVPEPIPVLSPALLLLLAGLLAATAGAAHRTFRPDRTSNTRAGPGDAAPDGNVVST